MFEPLSMLNGTSLDEAMLTDFVPAASAGGAILSIIVVSFVIAFVALFYAKYQIYGRI